MRSNHRCFKRMGAVRRGYARRFGAAADACCALRQCRFAALTLFVAPILPARSIRCSRHVLQLGVLLRPLARYPSWVFCCAFWPDDGHPLHSAHYIRPIAFVTECRRFGLIQFPSSQLPFFILTLRLFHHSQSLLSAGCKFGFCCIANAVLHGLRVALLSMRELTVNFYSFPSLFSRFLSSSLRACSEFASSLLLVPSRTICSCLIFGPNCQFFGTNLRLCAIRSALFLPSVNRDLGFCKNEASLGPFRSAKTVHNGSVRLSV